MSPSDASDGLDVGELVDAFRAEPDSAAILSDIDGTLAPICDDPGRAAVPAETSEVLRALATRYRLVACVSGRRANEARRIVGVDELLYAGSHGFELLHPGQEEAILDPAVRTRGNLASSFVATLDRERLRSAGLRIEDKGPIQALHWRGAPDLGAAEAEAAQVAVAARAAGLVPRSGRKVLEIRPVAGIDKGSAVTRLVREAGARRALFGGDDETDLDAFRALRWLVSSGRLEEAACVGISSDEEPDGLEERTDVLVEGTAGFLRLLRMLDPGG